MTQQEIEESRQFWSEKKRAALEAEVGALEDWRTSGKLWTSGSADEELNGLISRKLEKKARKQQRKEKKKEKRCLKKIRKEHKKTEKRNAKQQGTLDQRRSE
jgi:hypothetical protein